jgi:hypothetical protein
MSTTIHEKLKPWERTGLDYSLAATPFVDQFAEFCVHFPSGRALGPGRIGLRGNPFLYGFVEPLAVCELRFGGGAWIPVRRHRLNSLPWTAEEFSQADDLRIHGQHVFAGGARLVSRFEFENQGATARTFDLRWCGRLPAHEAVPEQYLAPFAGLEPEAFESWLEQTDSGWAGGWRSLRPKSDYPQPAFRLAPSGWNSRKASWNVGVSVPPGAFENGLGKTAGYALETDGPVVLEAGEKRVFDLIFDLAWTPPGESAGEFPEFSRVGFESLLAQARAKFEESIGAATPVQSESPVLESHLWRARHALLRTGYRSPRGEFGEKLACFCTSDDQFFSTVFFWDSLFSSSALAAFHPEFAKDAIRSTFVRQDERDGSCPENKWNYTVPQRNNRQYPQAPVGSWAVAHYLSRQPQDAEFLREIYPVLRNNHRYWADFADADGDGLAEWRWSGQTADDSPLYDAFVPGGEMKGCQWLPPVASVHLNCFLYRDADLLESFSRQLGLDDDAAHFAARKKSIYRSLMDVCWVEKDRRFWDFNHATRTHTKVRTFYMFWPLFARMPLPEDLVKEWIEGELLDPAKFFGAMPFPSVAYDEPKFDPTGYWRGKAWPQIAYWLVETLTHYGYKDAAIEAADRIAAWSAAQTGFPENMETDPRLARTTGHTDYNWGIAGFYMLATRRFLEFVP